MMYTFRDFLVEANAAGSNFEQKITRNVKAWLKANGLSNKFSASRYQQVTESKNGARDEDYSDIIVENLKTGNIFFIECKQKITDNIVTTMFDINKDFTLSHVIGRDREKTDDELLLKLSEDMQSTKKYQMFVDFLQQPSEKLSGSITPADLYFGNADVNDKDLTKLISEYNKIVDDGLTEADCKKFDTHMIRESTRNMLAIALLWRTVDTSHTWDICTLDGIPYFGDLIKLHYAEDKAVPAKYLQSGDAGLFLMSRNDNPLSIDCDMFPDDVSGKLTLKFTPRFGTGSCYITPRSTITSSMMSNCSFADKDMFPQVM